MGENTITISVDEYRKLLEASIRVELFADHVNREKYSISREDCGKFLSFNVSVERSDDLSQE